MEVRKNRIEVDGGGRMLRGWGSVGVIEMGNK